MIEDVDLGQRLVDGFADYYYSRKHYDDRGRISLYAYPDEYYIKLYYRISEYPQGWLYEIKNNFTRLAKEYLSDAVPGWRGSIEIID